MYQFSGDRSAGVAASYNRCQRRKVRSGSRRDITIRPRYHRAVCTPCRPDLPHNHSIYNVAFAVTEFRTLPFYQTVRAVREIAYARVLELPAAMPIVLTNWYSEDCGWSVENWDEVIALARRRGCPLLVVILNCSPEENARRIEGKERAAKRKPQNSEMVGANRVGRPLLDRGGDALLRLDVTSLSAESAAQCIAEWIGRIAIPA